MNCVPALLVSRIRVRSDAVSLYSSQQRLPVITSVHKMSSKEDMKWFSTKFSWYTAALSGAFGVCATMGTLRMRNSSQAADSILRALAPDSTAVDDISSLSRWVLFATFLVAGVVLAGSIFNIWCKLFMACRREKFANGEQEGCSSSCCCFSLLTISRFVMTVVHTFCVLAILWFAVLLTVQSLMVHLMWHSHQLAEGVAMLQNADQAAQAFTGDTSTWLEKREEDLSTVIFNMNGYCSRVQCGTTIATAMETLETLRKDTSDISTALEGQDGGACPAVGCLNLQFVWFLKGNTCLCDPDGIATLGVEARKGQEAAKTSVYFIFASLLALALLISKMSANIKSLVKDDHWIQRIELVLDRLGRAGVQVEESIVDIMHDASMSNYTWPQHNASAAPGNQAFGLPGGYAGVGAKAAIAPPSSVPEDAHDSIAAGNYTAGNTIDGLPHGRGRPAEAHL